MSAKKNNPKQQNEEKPVRYVLYARKSTESEDRQQKSLEDQIKECKEMAERDGLNIVEVIKESKSAKRSNNRPLFNEMLNNIRAGKKYDGIIAWHPDRLARNALEAGTIIDMLDNDEIRSLKFPTFAFTDDSNGKMVLGILFVISKQYSEHLSEQVKRGVKTNLEQGKSGGQYKWGYERNEEGYYIKDDNFPFMRRAWKMKLEGHTNREISQYLKDNDVHRITKGSKTRYEVNAHALTTIFHDSFYYGILTQADKEVDLRDYGNFEPMITEDEFNIVQDINYTTPKSKSSRKKRMTYWPLAHGFVRCGVCGGAMTPESSRGKGGVKYMYYRCHNKECSREIKGVRGGIVFDALVEELRHLDFTEKQYKRYEESIGHYTAEILEQLRSDKRSLVGAKTAKQKNLEALQDSYIAISKEKDNDAIKKRLTGQINELTEAIANIEDQIKAIDEKLANSSKIVMKCEEFLNTMNGLADKMAAADAVEKDILARKLISNTTIDNKNTPSFIWREPFASMIELSKNSLGWG